MAREYDLTEATLKGRKKAESVTEFYARTIGDAGRWNEAANSRFNQACHDFQMLTGMDPNKTPKSYLDAIKNNGRGR